MTKEVISVKSVDKVIDVAELLHQKGLNGVPVVENGKVLGMITEADLVSRGPASFHIPSLIKVFHEFKLEKYVSGKNKKDFQPIFEADAGSIMNTEYIFVRPDAEITELIKLFQEKHVNPIPVVNQEKNLVGIVSLSDIVKLISRFREAELDFLSTG
ncbi:MAG: CBS domain-containing protein [Candidatus Moraniibacteriota bacterium]